MKRKKKRNLRLREERKKKRKKEAGLIIGKEKWITKRNQPQRKEKKIK